MPSGIVLASLPLASLARIGDDVGLPAGAALTIVDRNGTILVREPDPEDWVGQTLPDVPHIAALLAAEDRTVEAAGLDGVTRLYALRSLDVAGATGIHISVGFELAQLTAAADRSFWLGMGLLLIAAGVALVLSWIGVRALLLHPVAELSAAADRIASGDLGARTGFSGGGEFGALATTFDRMADSVQERVEARTADLQAALDDLREHAARLAELAALIDGTNDALFAFDPVTLRFSHVNQGAIEQVGYSRDELLAMTPLDLKPRFTEASFRSMIAPLLDGSRTRHQFETVHRRKDGTEVPVEILVQTVPLEGQPLRLVAVVRDISERVEADRRLREYLDIASDPLFIHRAIRDESGATVDFEIAAFTEPALAMYGPEIARVGRRLSTSEPDTLEQRRAAYLRTLETGEPTVFRTRRRPPGSPNWHDISVRVTRVGDGVAVSARDITDELVNERRIQEYLDIAVDPLAVSRAIRDSGTGGIVDFEAVFANASATEILGPSFSTVGARLSAQPPDLFERRLSLWAQVVASGDPVEYDAALPHFSTGEVRDLSVRITKVGDGVAIAFRDVTSTKQLQRALESA
ncbi:MAG TPA: PAS domain S-box protein, partial [Candidatus Sulfomarinibacteraceae bacterium]|nr:PAS domain S-box protein [Candidatus Sulfomarinibacteraceae bacterium]